MSYQVTLTLDPQYIGTSNADNFTIIGKHSGGNPSDYIIEDNVPKSELITGKTYTVADTVTGGTVTATGICNGTVNWVGLNITPPPIEIDTDTEINIFFDSSGSMGSTEAPLNTMKNTILKNCLLPFFDNDSDLYDQRVRVTSIGNERAINWISTTGTTESITNVINLAFADESNVYEAEGPSTGGWVDGSTTGNADIGLLRTTLSNAPTSDYLRGIIFGVNTGPGSYPNYGQFLTEVFDGDGVNDSSDYYSGTNGLRDKSEVSFVNNVTPGSTPQYYADLIVTAINNLGYNLPSC